MMCDKFKRSLFARVMSLVLVFAFSFCNAGFAAVEENVEAPGIADTQSVLSVDDIGIPIDNGTVKSKYSGTSGRVIVHIQDAHCNYEAQSNICKILEQLTKENGVEMISVEGAEGIVDTAWFRAFPDAEIREEVADYFMKKGEITGAEFFSITSDYSGIIYGAETKDYYVQNLKAFTDVYPYKEMVEKYFINARAVANKLKSIIYPPRLKALDFKIRAFDDKETELSDYAAYLEKCASAGGVNLKDCSNFNKLLQTLEYEEKIDFDIVDQERSEYIDFLSKKLSKEQMEDLVGRSIEFKNGRVKAVDFYSYLRALAKEHNIPIVQEYPNLFYYYIYTKLYDGIDNEGLFREINVVERRLKKSLFENETQEELDKYSDMIDMFVSLVNIELTNEDYDLYKEYAEKFSLEDVLDFMARQCDKYNLNCTVEGLPGQISDLIPKMTDFYEIAMKRDAALIDNTLKQMEKDGQDRCVLIAGGFHTKGIKDLLERKGVSYVVVTPKITQDVETPYIKVLTNQRTSLEEIITESAVTPEGEKGLRNEGTRAEGGTLAPLARVAYTIPLYLENSDDLRLLSKAIGPVKGRDVFIAAEGSYRDIVSRLVREWLGRVKAGTSPEVWEGAVEGWPLLFGVYLEKYTEEAAKGGIEPADGFRVPEIALDAIRAEFEEIFRQTLPESEAATKKPLADIKFLPDIQVKGKKGADARRFQRSPG